MSAAARPFCAKWPDWRRVPSDALRASAAKTGIASIRVIDDMGQWVEIHRGIHRCELD